VESAAVAASIAPVVPTLDRDPTDRSGDRLLARLGFLEDAVPLFGSSKNVPRAGGLLAIAALVDSGIFACAQKIYGSLGPAFFGLRTTPFRQCSGNGRLCAANIKPHPAGYSSPGSEQLRRRRIV